MIINTVLSGLRVRPSNQSVRVSYHGDIVVGEGSGESRRSRSVASPGSVSVGEMGSRRVRVFAGARADASRALSGRDFMSIAQSRDFIADHCQRYLNATGVRTRLQSMANLGVRGERLYKDYQHVLQQITSFNQRGERAITARELSSLTRRVVLVATKSHRFLVKSQSSSVSSLKPQDALYDEMTFDKTRGRFTLKHENLLSYSVKQLALRFGAGRRYYARRAAQAFAEAVANKCGHNRLAYGVFRAQGHDMAALLSGDLLDDRGAFRPLSKGEVARASQMSRSQAEVAHQNASLHEAARSLVPKGTWWVEVAKGAQLSEAQAQKMPRAWLQDTIEAELHARFHDAINDIDKEKALQVAVSVVKAFARTPSQALKNGKNMRQQAQYYGRELVNALARGHMPRIVHAAQQFAAAKQAFSVAAYDPFYSMPDSPERASNVTTSLLMPLRHELGEDSAMKAVEHLHGDVGASWSCALGVLAEDARRGISTEGLAPDDVSALRKTQQETYHEHQALLDSFEEALIQRTVAHTYRQSENDVRAVYAKQGSTVRATLQEDSVRDDPLGSLTVLQSQLERQGIADVNGEDVVDAVRLYGGLWGAQLRTLN